MVIDAGLFHARGEINQRLLLRICTQLARCILESGQFSISVEDVELGLIRDEEAALVLRVGAGGAKRCELARIADVKVLNRRDQQIAVGSEILHSLEAAAEYHDRDQIARRHLRAQEFHGGAGGANLLGRLHG